MAKKKNPTWNLTLLTEHLKTGAYVKQQHFFYSKMLTLAEFQLVAGLTSDQLAKNNLVQKQQLQSDQVLLEDQLQELCLEFNFDFTYQTPISAFAIAQNFVHFQHHHEFVKRPPVITVMGHVDHGKTTLLDTLRHSHLTVQEVGQITQKLGAYQVIWQNNSFTFIDTPGHELFSLMRERGTEVTDLVILVVAANEGVRQQTIEALKHAQNSQVPIIVFLNKIDLPNLQIKAIKNELTKYNLVPTEWGGKTLFLEGSATKLATLSPLLDAIWNFANQQNLRYCTKCFGRAVVLEARQTSFGSRNDVLVQAGTFFSRQYLVTSNKTTGKLRILMNEQNHSLKSAGAGTSVAIFGLDHVLATSTQIYAFPNLDVIKVVNQFNNQQTKVVPTVVPPLKLEEVVNQSFWDQTTPSETAIKPVNLIIKVDSKGTEAVLASLLTKLALENKHFKLISLTTGNTFTIKELDLAIASKAQIILFGLKNQQKLTATLKAYQLKVLRFKLMYELILYLEKLGSLSNKLLIEVERGTAKVIEIFHHSKLGTIAGCSILSGQFQIKKNWIVKHYRNDLLLNQNLQIKSMQQGRQQIKTAQIQQEVGLIFQNKPDFKLGDRLVQLELTTSDETNQ